MKKSTIIGEKANGGLKMVDLGIVEIALKVAWIRRIRQDSDAAWKVIPENAVGHLGGFDFLLDCRYDLNLLQLHNLPPFYHSVLKYWQDYRSVISEDIIQVQHEIIWNNNNILVNQSTMFFKRWYKNGIIRIRDLLNVDFTFLSLDQFQRKYHLQVPFTTYYGLINSIPSSWRRKLKTTDFSNPSENSSQEPPPKNITTHSAYAAILDYFFQVPTAETRILRYGFTKENLVNVYLLPFLITREVKLQMFQYKIIHNILPTRCSLFRAKLSASETCQLCQALPQTLPHMLFQCTVINTFWHAFQNWWFEKTQQSFDLNECNVIYGWHNNLQSKDTLNYVSLVAKYFIFCRIQGNASVNFDSFPAFLRTRIDTLKQIAPRNKQLDNFYIKWKNFIWASFLFFSFICFLFSFSSFFCLFSFAHVSYVYLSDSHSVYLHLFLFIVIRVVVACM